MTAARRVDVAVVGAGIIGCLTAREILARAPDANVVVLDRGLVGGGASRRSAGLHFPRGATVRVRRMTRYSEDYYRKLVAVDPSLHIHPLRMSIVATDEVARSLPDVYLDQARLVRGGDLPELGIQVPMPGGVFSGEGCQYADVPALVESIVRELRGKVSVREGVRVVGIEPSRGGVVLRGSTGDRILADQVVLAPGPWLADPAWRDLVAPLGLRVKKIVALHVERRPAEDDPLVVFPEEDAFLLPLRHRGHWLFSHTCTVWDVDPDTEPVALSQENLAEAVACLRRYAPALIPLCTSGRTFSDAYSRDLEPCVRPLDDDGRVIFAGGANGSGYRLAPALAREAADLLHIATTSRRFA